jgi:hypothetical protein
MESVGKEKKSKEGYSTISSGYQSPVIRLDW